MNSPRNLGINIAVRRLELQEQGYTLHKLQRSQRKRSKNVQGGDSESGGATDLIMPIEPEPPTRTGVTQRRVVTSDSTHLVYKLHSLLSLDASDGADFLVVEEHAIKLVSCDEHLGTESRGYELRRSGEIVDHG